MTKDYERKFTTGGIVRIAEEVETGTSKAGKGWKKRVLIVDTGSATYPNPVKVTFWNDKVNAASEVNVNDEIEFSFYLRGSEYNERYKVELNGADLKVNYKAPAVETEAPEEPEEDDEIPEDMPF